MKPPTLLPSRGTKRSVAHSPGALVVAVLATVSVLAGIALVGGLPWRSASSAAPVVQAEVPVTATDHGRQPSNNSPLVIADPRDDRLLFLANRLDAPDFGCALHRSGDGGHTWVPADPVPDLPPGAEKCYAPEVAFDDEGTLYFLFVGLHGEGNEPMGAFLATSDDGGRTFGPPRQVLGPLEFGVRMAIDRGIGERGRLHLVWLHVNADPPLGGFPAGPNPILAAYSDDGGATFSTPVQVSDPARPRVVAPALALGDDHAVHVAYYDLVDDARDYQGLEGPVWEGTWSIVMTTSLDGGLRYGPGVAVDEDIAPPERPMLIFTMAPPSVAAGGNRVCAAWTDARHGDPDVLSRCSSREAQQWEAVRRVNDDPVGNGIHQYLPRISMAPGGRIDAVFIDRRDRPNNDLNHIYYAFSGDGGRSFHPSGKLTTRPWSPLIGQRYVGPAAGPGRYEIGARLGLLSLRSGAVAAWPDTRFPGPPQPGRTEQDVFAATLRFPSSGRPDWATGAGGALMAAGLVCGALLVLRRRVAVEGSSSTEAEEAGTVATLQHEPAAVESKGRSSLRPALVVSTVVATLGALSTVVLAREDDRPAPAPDLMPQVVDVITTEYSFEYQPPAKGGRTVFRIRNTGGEAHGFDLIPLPEDLPPVDEQLRGTERRSLPSLVDLGASRPGETDTVAIDLLPNQRYAILCFVRTPDTRDTHAFLGHNTEFRTG